jgi:Secretion system C-terminal sorting domain/HYR domain/SprB repeat
VLKANAFGHNATGQNTNDGSVVSNSVGGTAPYSYLWSNGSTSTGVNNLMVGMYNLTVTDANNCIAEDAFVIGSDNCNLNIDFIASNPSCFGSANGSIITVLTGGHAPFSFNWNSTVFSQNIENTLAGDYHLIITDLNGCVVTNDISLTQPTPLNLAYINVQNTQCVLSTDGQASVVATGGVGNYQYTWSNGQSGQNATNLSPIVYNTTVRDGNGCTFSSSIEINNIDDLSPVITANNLNLPLSNTGTVELTIQNLNVNVIDNCMVQSINIAPSTFDCDNLGLQEVTIFAIDESGNNATKTIFVTIMDNLAPTISTISVVDTLIIGSDGLLHLTLENLGLSVSDNCPDPNIIITPSSFNCIQKIIQTVTVVVTDAAGNSTTKSMQVLPLDNIIPTITCPTNVVNCASSPVVNYNQPIIMDNCTIASELVNQTQGLISGDTFPVGTTVNSFNYTDIAGNKSMCSFEVTILPPLELNILSLNDNTGVPPNGSIEITVNGGLPPYAYTWKNGSFLVINDQNPTGLLGGIYHLELIDAHGCSLTSEDITLYDVVNANEPTWATDLHIYPNPTSGRVVVDLGKNANAITSNAPIMYVYDAQGKALRHFELNKIENNVDLENLPTGLYLLKLQINGEQVLRRLIKQ